MNFIVAASETCGIQTDNASAAISFVRMIAKAITPDKYIELMTQINLENFAGALGTVHDCAAVLGIASTWMPS